MTVASDTGLGACERRPNKDRDVSGFWVISGVENGSVKEPSIMESDALYKVNLVRRQVRYCYNNVVDDQGHDVQERGDGMYV